LPKQISGLTAIRGKSGWEYSIQLIQYQRYYLLVNPSHINTFVSLQINLCGQEKQKPMDNTFR
jgi:hypothetical protein